MRLLLCLAVVGLTATLSFAADDPPKGGGTVQMLIAKIDGDKLVTSTSSTVTRSVTVSDKDGTKTIPVTETTTTSTARELKNLRATGPDDKEVAAADLKDKLKDGGLVVFCTTPLDPTWKAKFKPNTLFVEYAAPKDEPKPEDKKGEKKPDGN